MSTGLLDNSKEVGKVNTTSTCVGDQGSGNKSREVDSPQFTALSGS